LRRRQALTNRWHSRKTAVGFLSRWPLSVICLRSRILLCRGFRNYTPNPAHLKTNHPFHYSLALRFLILSPLAFQTNK
jgi:hypothetical protein